MARVALPLALALAALVVSGCFVPRPPAFTPYYEEVLSSSPFSTLVVEVDHAPGRAPSAAATTHLVETLKNVTSKRDVRLVVEASLPDEPDKRWSADALVALEAQTRSTRHAPPTAVLHVLYPAGQFDKEGVAGVTVSGPVIGPVTVFLDALRGLQVGPLPLVNPPPGVERLERSTLLHEAGHAMGLVDNGLPMVTKREDPDHEGHTKNEASVMYWRVESLNGLRDYLLRDGSVPDVFDADDRADLRSAGGR